MPSPQVAVVYMGSPRSVVILEDACWLPLGGCCCGVGLGVMRCGEASLQLGPLWGDLGGARCMDRCCYAVN